MAYISMYIANFLIFGSKFRLVQMKLYTLTLAARSYVLLPKV